MPTEDEIPLGLALFKVAMRYRANAENRLQNKNLPWNDLTVLAFLKLTGANGSGISQQELADSCDLDKASVVRVIDRLESCGLVSRVGSADDRRVNLISLTSAGQQSAANFLEVVRQLDEEAFVFDHHRFRTELSRSLVGLPKVRKILPPARRP